MLEAKIEINEFYKRSRGSVNSMKGKKGFMQLMQSNRNFTDRKRSCGKVMFLHLSASREGGESASGGDLHPGRSASRRVR